MLGAPGEGNAVPGHVVPCAHRQQRALIILSHAVVQDGGVVDEGVLFPGRGGEGKRRGGSGSWKRDGNAAGKDSVASAKGTALFFLEKFHLFGNPGIQEHEDSMTVRLKKKRRSAPWNTWKKVKVAGKGLERLEKGVRGSWKRVKSHGKVTKLDIRVLKFQEDGVKDEGALLPGIGGKGLK